MKAIRLRAAAWACLLLLFVECPALASEPVFGVGADASASEDRIALAIATMSGAVLAAHGRAEVELSDAGLAQLQLAAGRQAEAARTVEDVMRRFEAEDEPGRAQRWVPYLLFARAAASGDDFDAAYGKAFRAYFEGIDDVDALRTQYWFVADADRALADLRDALGQHGNAGELSLSEATDLARRQAFVAAYRAAARLSPGLVGADEAARYLVDDQVLIRTPQGATLSAVVARSRKADVPLPAAMLFTIYTEPEGNRAAAIQAAARGYVGVVVDARGKRLSRDATMPYETEADDAAAAVDWIARQPWSDGRVGMYGGSYSGFAAWAAAKRMPAALKTIVPYVAAIPGLGLPMENNVFLSANYAWPFYVTGNRLLDDETYFDRARWERLPETWFASGRPYREIDQVDGTSNPWLQRWLSHPAYDAYWQAMVPYDEDFARIDIPVLTITGYYDDGQISALQYFKEHYRHRPDAEHYLLIGPYDHFGAQAPFKPPALRGYEIDPVAQFDTHEITFQWLDHVLRGASRPTLLRDRVNYQVMGANEWRHAPSLAAAAGSISDFHPGNAGSGTYRLLSREPRSEPAHLSQTVDFSDRSAQQGGYYPDPIIRDALQADTGFAFATEPFEQPVSITGPFSGELKVRANKRDFDFTVVLYELMADGSSMQLSYYVGRASYARDMTVRRLLAPGEWTVLPFDRTRMTSRKLAAGSRLVVVVNVLKDAIHQVNMGTGRDVSDESIADAGEPLTVDWHTDSVIRVPLRPEHP